MRLEFANRMSIGAFLLSRMWIAFALITLVGITFKVDAISEAVAQDGSTGGSSTATPTTTYEIDTGSVFGPVQWGESKVPIPLSEFNPFDGQHYDTTPGELASLEVPPGMENFLDGQRVTAAWPSTTLKDRVNVEVHEFSIEASMVYAVEDDPTPELITRRTTRFYLRSGGYVIMLGKAHGKGGWQQRWAAARHFGRMPGYVTDTETEK